MLKVHRTNKGFFSVSIKQDEGFTIVISTSNSNRSRKWNSSVLYATYMSHGGTRNRRNLIFNLLDYFGNIIVVLSS